MKITTQVIDVTKVKGCTHANCSGCWVNKPSSSAAQSCLSPQPVAPPSSSSEGLSHYTGGVNTPHQTDYLQRATDIQSGNTAVSHMFHMHSKVIHLVEIVPCLLFTHRAADDATTTQTQQNCTFLTIRM